MARPVIFDLYHTLIDGADAERDHVLADMARVVGVAGAELITAYHTSWHDRLTRWGVEETIRILSRRLGANPTEEQITRAGALRRALAHRLLDTVPAATIKVLDTLRADGHPIALLSNATSDTAEAWPRSGLARRFDIAVFSCQVNTAKPDPVIYRIAADRLGVRTDQCVFVGDGADDELAGAATVGMSVVRTIEHNDSVPSWDGPTLATLTDLPALLRQWGSYPKPRKATTVLQQQAM